jgi:hypothetical protein
MVLAASGLKRASTLVSIGLWGTLAQAMTLLGTYFVTTASNSSVSPPGV